MENVIVAPLPRRAPVQQPKQQKQKKAGFTSLYSKGEELFNGISHIVGGALGVLALVLGLIYAAPAAVNMTAMSIFSVSIIVLYTMSALYHMLPSGRAKGIFRIFDHCTIYLLIAGTYTPYCMIALGGTTLGTVVLILEWACALGGIIMNAIAMNNKAVKVISMCFYVAMGWALAVGFNQLLSVISAPCFWLLLAGGIVYTVGIIFYVLGKKKYSSLHCVWHVFDLVGTLLQFASVMLLL